MDENQLQIGIRLEPSRNCIEQDLQCVQMELIGKSLYDAIDEIFLGNDVFGIDNLWENPYFNEFYLRKQIFKI